MNVKQITGAFLNMVVRVTISCIVVFFVYRLAMYSYHFGYMVFNDAAKELSPGRDITVVIDMDESALDIGKKLEQRGLIEDSRVFFVQEMLSEYHKELQPGAYTLNTSMKASELMAVMAEGHEDIGDMDGEIVPQSDISQTDDTAAGDDITDDGTTDEITTDDGMTDEITTDDGITDDTENLQ